MKRAPFCVVVTYAAPREDGRERCASPESTAQALASSASTVHGHAAHARSPARTLAEQLAEELADNLALAYVQPGDASNADICLVVEGEGLFLHDNRQRGLKPLRVDFESTGDRSRKQPLGRAIGRATRTVADATAGWGHDSRRLCAMGYEVTAIERNPLMSALLQDAAMRARRAGRGTVPEVIAADAIEFLAAHPGSWDCVYLDPMFPPKPRASTLSKRPLRLLRELVGDDGDKAALFEAARHAARRRIVIKRPDHLVPVFDEPDEVMKGKLVCYDVYHVNTGSR